MRCQVAPDLGHLSPFVVLRSQLQSPQEDPRGSLAVQRVVQTGHLMVDREVGRQKRGVCWHMVRGALEVKVRCVGTAVAWNAGRNREAGWQR